MERSNAKRSAACSQNPLHDDGLLQLILDFVGVGDFFFVGAVSKQFKRCSLQLSSFKTFLYTQDSDADVRVEPCTTLCSSIFGSVSRLRLAIECGFPLDVQNSWPGPAIKT